METRLCFIGEGDLNFLQIENICSFIVKFFIFDSENKSNSFEPFFKGFTQVELFSCYHLVSKNWFNWNIIIQYTHVI